MKKWNNIKYLALLILISGGVFTIPFLITFSRTSLSEQITDWGAFGSYFSLVISAANLAVFVYLTTYIASLDENRHLAEIRSQRLIAISHIRQAEIDNLSQRLNSMFEHYGTEPKSTILRNISVSSFHLKNFIDEKHYLFPVVKENRIIECYEIFQKQCGEMIALVDEFYEKEQLEELTEGEEDILGIKILVIVGIRNKVIDELQKFHLSELSSQ